MVGATGSTTDQRDGGSALPFSAARTRSAQTSILDDGGVSALGRLRSRVEQLRRHRSSADSATMPMPRPHRPDPPLVEAGTEADIVVLGPVRVRHPAHLTPQQQALVGFLALHPGSPRPTIVEALWAGKPVSESRFLNLVAETRAVVGSAHLPPAAGGRYSINGLSLDADVLRRASLAATGCHQAEDPAGEMVWLRRGLALISGRLLDHPGNRYWTWLDDSYPLMAELETVIVDMAFRLAELAVGSSDRGRRVGGPDSLEPALAEWAYRRCLVAVPHQQRAADALAAIYRRTGRRAAADALERSRRNLA